LVANKKIEKQTNTMKERSPKETGIRMEKGETRRTLTKMNEQ